MSNKGRGLSVILDRSSFLCSITIVLGVTSAGAGHYVAKVDLNNATGFDAVKATIEVVPVSILNTNDTCRFQFMAASRLALAESGLSSAWTYWSGLLRVCDGESLSELPSGGRRRVHRFLWG
jgi:hypothetical protein